MRWNHSGYPGLRNVLFGQGLEVPEMDALELLEIQISKTPAAKAIQFEGRWITFQELGAKVNAYAGFMVRKGVRRGDRVSTLLPRGIDHVAIAFATWKAGGTYQPI